MGRRAPDGEDRERLSRLTHLEVAPPAWLVRAVVPKPASFPWPETVQAVLAITVPLAVGAAAGELALASFLAMGGLVVGMTNSRGPLLWKLRRSGTALLAGALGLLAGLLTGAHLGTAVAAILGLSFAAAVVSVIGGIASLAALQLLVYAAIGGALAGRVPAAASLLAMLAGGLWGLLCMAGAGLVAGYRRVERESVATVFQRIAELLAATGTPWMEDARRALTDALNDAFDTLSGIRARTAGRDWRVLRLAALLNTTTPLVEATVAIAHAGGRPPPELHDAAMTLAEAVRTQGPAPRLELDPAPGPLLKAWRQACSGVLSRWDRAAIPPRPPSARERLRSGLDQIASGRGTWLFVLRLVLCMMIAEVLERTLPIAHSYWIVMTVALVLKPDFGSVFVRGLQRGLGTVVGVILGFGIVLLLPDPPLLLLGIAVMTAILPYAILRNYGMLSTFLTPLVLLLVELATPGGRAAGMAAGEARLADTLIGCLVVVVAGYALWPETWTSQLPGRLGGAAAVLADYLAAGFTGDLTTARQLRRRAYRLLSDLRTAFQQTLAEPPPASTRAQAWWPVVAQLETVADAVTEAAVAARAGGPAPRPETIHHAVAAMRTIAAQLRSGGEAPRLPAVEIGDDPAFEGVAAAISATENLLAGPAVLQRHPRRARLRRRHGTPASRRGLQRGGPGSTQQR